MRIAIITLTNQGLETAKRVSSQIDGQIFHKGRDFDKLSDLVAEIFNIFDAMIFICATGIVVRIIALHIVSKLSDPAIIVIDERGRNVISLLSGHVGGANDLALKIAAGIHANPVITTATDVENKLAADSFISELGLRPEPKNAIKAINSAILRGESVYLTAGDVTLNLVPQNLIAGVGCKRGTSLENISNAVQNACERINQSVNRIKMIASVDIKKDEEGLLAYSKSVGIEMKFFSVDELQKKILEYKLDESEFVKKIIGVGNVCEAAALCCIETKARFALQKTTFQGGVTVALLWEK